MKSIHLLLFAVLLAANICRTEGQTQTDCPVVRCARPDCPESDWIQQYFDDDERCPACWACGEMCQDIVCPAVTPPCEVRDQFRDVLTVGGEKCFGCTQCKDVTPAGECPALPPGTIGTCVEACSSDDICPDGQLCCSNGCGHTCQDAVTLEVKTDCPVYGCVDPGCNNPKRTFFTMDDGTRCEECPKCRKRDICPAVKCKAKQCPRGTVRKRKYKRINGVRCKMCYKCVTKKNRKN